MRRLLVSVVALGSIILGMFAAPAGAGIRWELQADAFFLLDSNNGVREGIWVHAIQMDPVLDDYLDPSARLFSISAVTCRRADWDSCKLTDRRISGRLSDTEVLEFERDLTSAVLKVTRRGQTHIVRWEATTDPGPHVQWMDCLTPIDGAGPARTASASGRVFGHKVKSAPYWGPPPALRLVAYGPGCRL